MCKQREKEEDVEVCAFDQKCIMNTYFSFSLLTN